MKRKKYSPEIEKQILALEAFSSDSFLTVNKRLLSHFGPQVTIFLCNIIDKYKYFKERGYLNDDGSFFLRYQDQSVQTGMKEDALRRCKNQLIKERIISTEMRGIPRKEYYYVHLDILVEKFLKTLPLDFSEDSKTFGTIDRETQGIETGKPRQYTPGNPGNIKETKYKETKYKETKSSSSMEEEEKSPSTSSNGKITPSQFEAFWKAYPRKIDKGKAKTAWEKLCHKKNGGRPNWKEIRSAIHFQKKSERWQDHKYIPHPTTWLNQSRWLDDPKEMKNNTYSSDIPKSRVTIGSGLSGRPEYDNLP